MESMSDGMLQFDFMGEAEGLAERLTEIRRDFHRNPELSFQEFRTAGAIAEILRGLGLQVREKVGGTGVVGLLKGANPGPTIAIRADIDALPILELAEVPFRSRNEGVMHACGHDVHAACGLGAAMLATRVRDRLRGDLLFLFQPAEEKNLGAKAMVEEGVMSDPRVDMIFGLHNHPEVPAGRIAVKEGALMAAVDTIFVKITGKGGHGALPHRDIDPIVAASSVVMNVQTIVSRNVEPSSPAVVSFGSIRGGEANNVIPDCVELSGTVRSYDPATRDLVERRLREMVEASAAALGCRGELTYRRDLPPVLNDPLATCFARSAVESLIGAEGVVDPVPSMGGEDFAVFMERAPGCFLWLGVGNADIGAIHPWHSPLFMADERALPLGAAVLVRSAINAMEGLARKRR